MAPKRDAPSSRMPRATTVKLDQKMFADVWWTCRVEGITPAALLKELAGTQADARRRRHEATITRLAKSDAEQDQILAQAKRQE